jgi:type IV secretory pathway ATPase VirB11/archaellum biosynthesis ATPase
MENKRQLEWLGKNGRLFSYIGKPLIKYFEDNSIEDLQIIEIGKVRLIKRNGLEESIVDETITAKFIKILMNFIAAIAPQRLNKDNSQVSMMLPVNAFRFTGAIGDSIKSGVKISIRLNDNIIGYSYKDFSLKELEFNFLTKHICDNRASAFVIGEVGSGKTTFNNLIIQKMSENELINVVGDIHDFIFSGNQAVSDVFARSEEDYQHKFDLLMRSNPKRILIPELTSINVNFILRVINSGVKGILLTMHASSEELGVAQAFTDNLKMAKSEADEENIYKRINTYIDFLIHLGKDSKGRRAIEKIVINNDKILQEAKELNILGFSNGKHNTSTITREAKPKPKPDMIKILKEYSKGIPVVKLSKKYDVSRVTVYNYISLSNKVSSKKLNKI